MRASFGFPYALTLAAIIGLGLTWLSVADDAGWTAARSGAWAFLPQAATPDADSYARAVLARSGELPLGAGEGLAFTATHDRAGVPLHGRCRYRVAPLAPPARWWTLSLYTADGEFFETPAGRHGFTSGEVLRDTDGTATIAVAAEAASGNWLPAPRGPFSLVLRLYDTALGGGAALRDAAVLPSISAEACR